MKPFNNVQKCTKQFVVHFDTLFIRRTFVHQWDVLQYREIKFIWPTSAQFNRSLLLLFRHQVLPYNEHTKWTPLFMFWPLSVDRLYTRFPRPLWSVHVHPVHARHSAHGMRFVVIFPNPPRLINWHSGSNKIVPASLEQPEECGQINQTNPSLPNV